jgi:hypothetical protein
MPRSSKSAIDSVLGREDLVLHHEAIDVCVPREYLKPGSGLPNEIDIETLRTLFAKRLRTQSGLSSQTSCYSKEWIACIEIESIAPLASLLNMTIAAIAK